MTDLPPRVRPLRPGDPVRIGAYELVGNLGAGGMGVVYVGRALDGALVAIKVVRAELVRNPEFRERFRREARSAMRVPRFCTAEVLDADPDAPSPYLVTEYIDGPTLEEVVTSGGPLQRAELDQLGVSMLAALQGIHKAGVTHRDLKPSNVLLSRMGPRVIDFGIASAVDATPLTADGQALGTPTFMAPEQLQGFPVQASDVFAWGGVMAFAATGRQPFGTGPLTDVAARIMYSEPDLGGLGGPLREVLLAALGKDPALRPTPARLLDMLGVSGPDPVQAAATRLALPTDQTRLDYVPPTTPQLPPAAPYQMPQPEPELRFGPGVPAVEAWHGGHRAQRRPKRRLVRRIGSLLSTLVTIGIIGAVAWILLHRGQPAGPIALTDLRLDGPAKAQTCNASVMLTGTVLTNGKAGDVTFQWKRSDQKQPETVQHVHVPAGQSSVSLPFTWQIGGHGHRTYTATLSVLGATPLQKTTSFPYTCTH
ncbi:MAG TPA: serine/threonine-protein kinase [Streptosporangiaceae bacterium]|nr:serine/threonine-protein kinase [Streptosporangiaceae bacterium]